MHWLCVLQPETRWHWGDSWVFRDRLTQEKHGSHQKSINTETSYCNDAGIQTFPTILSPLWSKKLRKQSTKQLTDYVKLSLWTSDFPAEVKLKRSRTSARTENSESDVYFTLSFPHYNNSFKQMTSVPTRPRLSPKVQRWQETIYDYIISKFPPMRIRKAGKISIRVSLSLNECFVSRRAEGTGRATAACWTPHLRIY